jgi:hypothetical protein
MRSLGKNVEESGHGMVLSRCVLVGSDGKHKKYSDSRSVGRNVNPESALAIRRRHSECLVIAYHFACRIM